MSTFGEVLTEFQDVQIERQRESASDVVRRKHVKKLSELTGRNTVLYYSGWLSWRGPEHYFVNQINDEDKHGFMAVFAGLDFEKDLDLVLHTPGGDVAATESIIDYIRSKFQDRVRVIVPQISMSGGTMIALAGKEIVMGRHSNLGPIDPQLGNKPAFAILKEFERARQDIAQDPATAPLWIPILQQYAPTLLSTAEESIKWAREIGKKALVEGSLVGRADKDALASTIVEFLLSDDLHHAHGRHLHRDELAAKGLPIVNLEDDPELQDAVLTVHHSAMLSMSNHGAIKIIENQNGIAHMKLAAPQIQMAPISKLPPQLPQAPQPLPVPTPGPELQIGSIPWGQRFLLAIKLLLGR